MSSVEIFLVRHGEAKSELEDPSRPLSEQGRIEVKKVGRALLARNIAPVEILHSDKLRAKETAEVLSRILTPQRGIREIAGLGPQDDPFVIQPELAVVRDPLILVGHLPHIGRLASLLMYADPDRDPVDFSPAGVVCLARRENRWEMLWKLRPGSD
jgi:phosphohistidine phosphatase